MPCGAGPEKSCRGRPAAVETYEATFYESFFGQEILKRTSRRQSGGACRILIGPRRGGCRQLSKQRGQDTFVVLPAGDRMSIDRLAHLSHARGADGILGSIKGQASRF